MHGMREREREGERWRERGRKRMYSWCIVGTRQAHGTLPLFHLLDRMGARIAAMAHHPNDGNHAGTTTSLPSFSIPLWATLSRSLPSPFHSLYETHSGSLSPDPTFLLTLCCEASPRFRWPRLIFLMALPVLENTPLPPLSWSLFHVSWSWSKPATSLWPTAINLTNSTRIQDEIGERVQRKI